MNWLVSNWVERRAARDRHLRKTSELWRNAQLSIEEACATLHQHYADVATVRRTKQNENLVVIAVTQVAKSSTAKTQAPRTNLISIEFKPETPAVFVALNGLLTQEFPIDADPDHVFITLDGHEVLLDEFSRLALEEAFFNPPVVKQSCGPSDPDTALEMAREFIRRMDAASDTHTEPITEMHSADRKNAA